MNVKLYYRRIVGIDAEWKRDAAVIFVIKNHYQPYAAYVPSFNISNAHSHTHIHTHATTVSQENTQH